MKKLCDYENTQSATADLPCGAFKNESSPGQKDGTDILAEHIQDIAYPLFQVLQLAGEVPNGELEDGNNKKQFLKSLCNIGIFKYSDTTSYLKGNIVLQNLDGSLSMYRSLVNNNNFDLSDLRSWVKLLTIDNNNKINFYVDTNIGGSGSSMPVFCFNSGPVDENGEPALLTLNNNILTQHSPAVCTTAGGDTYTISEDVSVDISELEAGTYNVFYNTETKGLEVYQNTIFWQKAQPANWSLNDIWVDDSVQPRKSYMKKSDTDFIEVKIVPNAEMTLQ